MSVGTAISHLRIGDWVRITWIRPSDAPSTPGDLFNVAGQVISININQPAPLEIQLLLPGHPTDRFFVEEVTKLTDREALRELFLARLRE